MEKRYQVFVSSTYEDLQEERREVMQALLELDCIPAGMELFPASNDDQWTLIKRVIDDCDYYLLIVGGRYGRTNDKGISYTQMEFEYALSTCKPIISFIRKNPENIPSGKCEQTTEGKEKLLNFIELTKRKLIKYWETPVELGSVVSRSMVKLIKDYPAEGWVKAGSIVDTEATKEIARLQKENRDLNEKLKSINVGAPEDVEDFAQGDDVYELEFSFTASTSSSTFYEKQKFTWNELFYILGPSYLKGADEDDLYDVLKKHIEEELKKRFSGGFGYVKSVVIDTESFNRIMIQFRALGISTLIKDDGRNCNKWELTPYGDSLLMKSMAIRR